MNDIDAGKKIKTGIQFWERKNDMVTKD